MKEKITELWDVKYTENIFGYRDIIQWYLDNCHTQIEDLDNPITVKVNRLFIKRSMENVKGRIETVITFLKLET